MVLRPALRAGPAHFSLRLPLSTGVSVDPARGVPTRSTAGVSYPSTGWQPEPDHLRQGVRPIFSRRLAVYSETDSEHGLRWEYESPITEANNLLGNFNPTAPSGMVQESGGNTVYKSDFKDFGPRLGLAWDVTGKGTTVVRAGGGLVNNYCCNIQSLVGLGGTSASLNAVPTGFTLVAANGTTVPSPGTITAGLANSPISWAINTPVFNTTSSALKCGNGLGSTNVDRCRECGRIRQIQAPAILVWLILICIEAT